jgi:dihydroflavonol-4-reductase
LKRNYRVKCLVRQTSNLRWLQDKPVELIYGNDLKKSLEDVDYVYHCAGATAAKSRQGYLVANRDATRSLIKFAYQVNPNLRRFVFVSSQAAVGPAEAGKPVDETAHYHPITAYGISKMEAEKVVQEYFDKLKCTIVRPPSVYGPRDTAILAYFQSINRRLNPIIGFSQKQFSLIHGLDLVKGIILAGESEKAVSNIYFITSERFYSYKEVGGLIGKILQRKHLTVRVPAFIVYTAGFFTQLYGYWLKKPPVFNLDKAKDMAQQYWICSGEKVRKELGFKEQFSLEEGIKNTIEWYKQHGWLK